MRFLATIALFLHLSYLYLCTRLLYFLAQVFRETYRCLTCNCLFVCYGFMGSLVTMTFLFHPCITGTCSCSHVPCSFVESFMAPVSYHCNCVHVSCSLMRSLMMALLSDPCLTFNCVHISRSFTGSLVTRVSYLQLCTRLLQFLEVLSNSVSYLQRCTRVLQFLKVLDDGDFILPPMYYL